MENAPGDSAGSIIWSIMEIKLQFNSRLNLRRNIPILPEDAVEMTISTEEVIEYQTAEEAELKTKEIAQGFKKYIKSLRESLYALE